MLLSVNVAELTKIDVVVGKDESVAVVKDVRISVPEAGSVELVLVLLSNENGAVELAVG